jgi:hypothetical protein
MRLQVPLHSLHEGVSLHASREVLCRRDSGYLAALQSADTFTCHPSSHISCGVMLHVACWIFRHSSKIPWGQGQPEAVTALASYSAAPNAVCMATRAMQPSLQPCVYERHPGTKAVV